VPPLRRTIGAVLLQRFPYVLFAASGELPWFVSHVSATCIALPVRGRSAFSYLPLWSQLLRSSPYLWDPTLLGVLSAPRPRPGRHRLQARS